MAKTKDALKIIDQMVGDDAELRQMIADESVNAAVAQMIYDARTDAGLTQKELADRVGTKQPVIARLEDAEYQGHSLSMLNRIAEALNQRLRLHMTAIQPPSAEKMVERPKPATPSRTRAKRPAACDKLDGKDLPSRTPKDQQRPRKQRLGRHVTKGSA